MHLNARKDSSTSSENVITPEAMLPNRDEVLADTLPDLALDVPSKTKTIGLRGTQSSSLMSCCSYTLLATIPLVEPRASTDNTTATWSAVWPINAVHALQ